MNAAHNRLGCEPRFVSLSLSLLHLNELELWKYRLKSVLLRREQPLNCLITGFQGLIQLLGFIAAARSHIGATAPLAANHSRDLAHDVPRVQPPGQIVSYTSNQRSLAVGCLAQHNYARL